MPVSLKPTIWVISICVFAVILVLSGAQAAQSSIASEHLLADDTPTSTATSTAIFTVTLTLTPTATSTSTPTATSTSTPSPTPTSTPTPIEIVIEEPDINPAYGAMCDSYWYSYTNSRGYQAYLTLNVNDPSESTNSGEWRPTISQTGYYSVEAYIPYHNPINWECPEKIISSDTSDAHYRIYHANGQTLITSTQNIYSNEWLPLGEHLFHAGSDGYAILTDLNEEETLTTTVSFSAMRFTWQRPPPEQYYLPLVGKLASTVITSTVAVQNAPAFDQCHLPTTTQMQKWWNYSPYRIANVYLGGGLLYHECTVPDSEWIETIRNQGWGIIPTWVGPQAPCSDFRLRMSSVPAVAYQEGQAEADAALLVAQDIGLTGWRMGGTIIYYDVEAYGTSNRSCREAVKSFIAGWTQRLHNRGNQAGAYGVSCNSNVSDWAYAVYPPDDLWVAAVGYPRYRENVPLFGITCLADNLWPNHQRIRQYTAGHNETWGNVTFSIDSNIADAEVVSRTSTITNLVYLYSFANPSTEVFDYSSNFVQRGKSWMIADGTLYASTPSNPNWNPVQDLPSSLAMRKVFFLDKWSGWAIAASSEGRYTLLSTINGGNSWVDVSSIPIESGWSISSLQFTNTQHGWIALKKLTRNIFSVGRLLQTSDGGGSWQTLELPVGEAVRFTSGEIGWVAGGVSGNELYQTQDSGRTWKLVTLPIPKGIKAVISLPVFTDKRNGMLVANIFFQDETALDVYTTRDGGETWQWINTITILPEGLTTVNFTTPLHGWASTNVGTCKTGSDGEGCILETKLWQTQDGGKTWEPIDIPK